MSTARLSILILCLLSACTSDSPSRTPEPEPNVPDSGPDGRTPDPIVKTDAGPDGRVPAASCEQVRAELRVLEERASCEADSDCVILGYCGGDTSFRTVRKRDEVEGQRLFDEAGELCGRAADGPNPSVECVEGMCTLIGADFENATKWCGMLPDDAGSDDGGSD